MLWLGVHFPLLPLEVFANPTCRSDLPVANTICRSDLPVANGRGQEAAPTVVVDERSRVILRNDTAMKAGIAHGSTLATAHSILPGLVHYRRCREREQQRLKLLAEALYGFSARVTLAAEPAGDDPPPGVMLEIGGSLKLFGDAAALTERVETLCRDMGHEARLRRAATPLAALVLARSDAATLGQVPLAQAAVEPRGLTAEQVERFANMGIHTLGQLLALPRRGLAQRFGTNLVSYLARLTGDEPDPRPAIRPAEHFRAALHLLDPLKSKEALVFPLQRLLNDLQHWLVARQLGAEQLRWHFTGSGATAGGPHRTSMSVRFARAQQSREAFLEITRLQLAEATLPEEVTSLTLETRRLRPWASVAGSAGRGLFGNLPGLEAGHGAGHRAKEGTGGLDELVDQLRARLGRDACHTLEPRDQHAPEQAWRPALPLRTASTARAGGKPGKRMPQEKPVRPRKRPLWLFDPPRPIDRRELELLKGPERIHTGWWLTGMSSPPGDASGQARDYYVARHASGARCWVFTDPGNRWFLHGYFS